MPRRSPTAGSHAIGLDRFSQLASAIAGRRLHVALTVAPRAQVDGATITLVTSGADFEVPEDAALTVAVLAAIVSAGGLDAACIRRVLRAPGAMSRYMTLEAARAATVLGHALPQWVLERIQANWAGLVPASAGESAELAIGRSDIPDAPPEFGQISRVLVPELNAAPPPPDLQDEASEDPASEEPADEQHEGGKPAAKSHIAVGAPFRNPLTKLMRSILGGQNRAEDGGSGDTGVRSAVTPDAPPSQQARVVRAKPPRRRAATPTVVGHSYPEWDRNNAVYRPQWCRVVELDPAVRSDIDPYAPFHDRGLTRSLARITASYERHDRQAFGDALDLAALVDFEVLRRAGQSTNSNVYQQRRKTATDVSVLVLLDCSGSEAESSGGQRIWDRQRRVAGAILESLEKTGARSAAYGFNSHGRRVRMLRVKSFNEALGPRAEQRLMSLEPAGFTRMGAALRHAATLVCGAGTPRKLLLVISDGLPYDDEYEDLYAQSDTRKALEEAATAGVGCACFAIGTTTSTESLERMWGSAAHARLPDGRQWARPIGPAIEAALWSVTRVQRATSRLETATA